MEVKPLVVLKGEVVHGKALGRKYDLPTANINVDKGVELPEYGVYAALVYIDGEKYYGTTNIGKRPTVDDYDYITIETHIENFDQDIYGKVIEVAIYKKLRGDKKFNSIEELISQIKYDCTRTIAYFSSFNE